MKNNFNSIYIGFFTLLCFLPMFLFGVVNVTGMGKVDADIEKKVQIEMPSLITAEGINKCFDDEFEAWVNQNIPFRSRAVTVINTFFSDGIKEPVANVVTGKDGWIYSEETVDNFIDANSLSEEEIRNIAISLSLIEERVEEEGGVFLFVPVPNKNSIYPEYMPQRYRKADSNNLTRLYDELDKSGINYVDIKDKLLTVKDSREDVILYYKRDTHWTDVGACYGYEAIMYGLGKTPVSYDVNNYSVSRTRRGDLDKLLFPAEERLDDEYIYDYQIDSDLFEFTYPAGMTDTMGTLKNYMSDREDHDNKFTSHKIKETDGSSLYMVRDSFARALLPYMIKSFDKATFVRSSSPDFETYIGTSSVVYEICERNLENLISSAPFLYAPKRENININRQLFVSDLNRCNISDEGYALKLYGTIHKDMLGENGRIYVHFTSAKDDIIFEAFPIYEDSLGDCEPEAGGFSLYIDKNMLKGDEYTVTLQAGAYESEVVGDVSIDNGRYDSIGNSEGNSAIVLDTDQVFDAALNDSHKLFYRGSIFGIGDNINDKLSELGNQAAPSELIISCLSGEDATVYSYPSITIETDINGNIYYISLMDNSYSDGKQSAQSVAGITLGSDREYVIQKLGEPSEEKYSMDIYRTNSSVVAYSYKDNKVVSIIMEDSRYESESAESDSAQTDTTTDSGRDESASDNTAAALDNTDAASDNTAAVSNNIANSHVSTEVDPVNTGWQIVNGEYYFYDRITGVRIKGQTVDGIVIGENGEVNPTEYEKNKIDTMIKAHKIMVANTDPSDSMEQKRKKVFDWVLSFPYHRYRKLKDVYTEEGIEIIEANDIFDQGAGDCVSEAAAVAFLFHEIGYENVYWVHDTGHSWVRCDDKLFDPLFAEARSYEENYNAEFTDYRASMSHCVLIY